MGPSAWHTEPARVRERIAALAEPLTATVAVDLGVYTPLA
jgi:23S rRNA (guanine745-N1)-methyltransferase